MTDKEIRKKIKEIEKSLPFTPCPVEDIINKYNATYTMIVGERSNGKSYGALQYCLLQYHETGRPFAYIRRTDKSIKRNPLIKLFGSLVNNGIIYLVTDGKYNNIEPKGGDVYFMRVNDDGEKDISPEPFCYCYALNTVDSSRGGRPPEVENIIFDEFIPLNSPYGYIDPENETDYFKNTISNIMGYREPKNIIMVANTIDQHSCYFQNMRITGIKDMKSGQIDLYKYKQGGKGSIAVAMSSGTTGGKPNDYIYEFDGEENMITGASLWDFDRYPKLSKDYRYKPKDVLSTFVVSFDDVNVLGDLVIVNDCLFLHFAKKTTDLKNPDTDIIYSKEYDPRPNWFRSFEDNRSKVGVIIRQLYNSGKCYFSSNSVGDLVRSFQIRN